MNSIKSLAWLCLLTAVVWGQTQISMQDNYSDWGWQAVVMENGLITVATVPVIGARIMQYDLGGHPSIYINSAELGKTHKPDQAQWYNYGGYKCWPAPQVVWNWPPPAVLDQGPWIAEIVDNTTDSVSVYAKSPVETWSKTPNLSEERRTVIYKNSSHVKVVQTIINEGAKEVNWSVWGVTQSIVNHQGQRDFENFWVYFPIKTEGSIFGDEGVKTSDNFASSAWKGEVAPGIYGVQYKADGQKIFADSPEGWIVYVDEGDGYGYAKLFDIFEGENYPDDGARNEVWIQNGLNYCEVEVVSPIWPIAPNGGKISFTENWYAARINGPVIAVNSVGMVETHLLLDNATGDLYGSYGVFHLGTAKLLFLDGSGNIISEGATFSVSPLEKLEIEQKIDVPKNTATAEIQLFDADGVLIGVLDTIAADKITAVTDNAQPLKFTLLRNYPNPFNPQTTLSYELSQLGDVTLAVYDLSGRLMETLTTGRQTAGVHQIVWNAAAIPSGIYLAKLTIGKETLTAKMAVVK